MDEITENVILTREQKELLLSFAESPLSPLFYLSGGTALSAFYLHHRLSEDLDFFTMQETAIEDILAFLKSIPAIKQMTYERKYDRRIFLLGRYLCNHANQSIPADRRSHRSNRKKVWSERDRVYTFRMISGATCL